MQTNSHHSSSNVLASSLFLSLRAAVVLCAAVLLSGCAAVRPNSLCTPCDPLDQDACVNFHVIFSVSGRPDTPINDAPVFLSSPRGLLFLGQADSSGDFFLPRSALQRQADPALLVFCWDHSSLACTAVRLDLPDISHWNAFNVTLPPNPLDPLQRALPATLTLETPQP